MAQPGYMRKRSGVCLCTTHQATPTDLHEDGACPMLGRNIAGVGLRQFTNKAHVSTGLKAVLADR